MSLSRERKNKGNNFRVYVATSFSNAVYCEIEALARPHSLANAQFVRELFLRGLSAYHRDGKLSEVTPHDHNELAPTNQLIDEGFTDVAA